MVGNEKRRCQPELAAGFRPTVKPAVTSVPGREPEMPSSHSQLTDTAGNNHPCRCPLASCSLMPLCGPRP